jgi:hypothetical protein
MQMPQAPHAPQAPAMQMPMAMAMQAPAVPAMQAPQAPAASKSSNLPLILILSVLGVAFIGMILFFVLHHK